MIQRLKDILDVCEEKKNPIFKEIFLKVAKLPDNIQNTTLDLMLMMVENDTD